MTGDLDPLARPAHDPGGAPDAARRVADRIWIGPTGSG